MAIDMDAIRRKLGQLSGANSKRNIMWRPEEGEETTVRLIAYPNNDGQPFKELMFYYNIGNNPGLLAPYQFGNPDPIQELINKLRDDGSKESYELAKKLYPKMRCFAPVIVRGEEDKGVRLWAFGKQIYQSLLNYMLDEDYGDITDVDQGVDFTLTYTLPKTKGAFPQTNLVPKRKSSALAATKSGIKEFISNVPDVNTLFARKSPAEVKAILESFLNPEDGPLVEDLGVSSVDEAIAELSA